MTISVLNKNLIKVESSYIQGILDGNSEDFTSIEITSNINCCKDSNNEEVTKTTNIAISNNKWYLDLTTPVGLNAFLQFLQVQSLVTTQKFDVPDSGTDLGYVDTECIGSSCTMQDFDTHFAPIFEDALNAWFASVGIATTITVTFDGNTVIVDGIPTTFALCGGKYGDAETFVPASYGSASGVGAFLGSDALYLAPSFFEGTAFIDGVYKVTVKYSREDNSYVQETNCAFVDITKSCSVAEALVTLVGESKNKNVEQVSTMIHLLHYGLVNGSNCGCNCADLCTAYTELVNLLSDIPQTNNCGC